MTRSEFLSSLPTKSGRRHDKRLFDKAMGGRNIPPSVTAWTDTGFQGLQRDHQHTIMPMKATKYHRLTEEEKTDNRLISGIRVISEHAIAGIKRFRSTTDVYRNRIANLDDIYVSFRRTLELSSPVCQNTVNQPPNASSWKKQSANWQQV